eukprot:422180-Rhodomonas_salina.1
MYSSGVAGCKSLITSCRNQPHTIALSVHFIPGVQPTAFDCAAPPGPPEIKSKTLPFQGCTLCARGARFEIAKAST